MKILGIIPARGGSKGVPGKNIKPLFETPLIGYTINAALASKLSEIIVSTDDEKIKAYAESVGVNVPFIRPEHLASDTAKSIDVAVHAFSEMEKINNCKYDAFMLLQPTTPFRTTEDINEAIEILQSNAEADSVISVVNVEGHHPARMKFIEDGILIDPPFGEVIENQNRQELRPMFIRNGAIYLTKREILLSGSYKGNKCMSYIMPAERSINIDTLRDFALSEWIYNYYLK